MLLFADDQNRARRATNDAFRRAADAKMPPAGVTVSGHDDKIDIQITGGLHDFVRRMAGSDCCGDVIRGVPARRGGESGQILPGRR